MGKEKDLGSGNKQGEPSVTVRAAILKIRMAFDAGDIDRTSRLFTEAVDTAEELGDEAGIKTLEDLYNELFKSTKLIAKEQLEIKDESKKEITNILSSKPNQFLLVYEKDEASAVKKKGNAEIVAEFDCESFPNWLTLSPDGSKVYYYHVDVNNKFFYLACNGESITKKYPFIKERPNYTPIILNSDGSKVAFGVWGEESYFMINDKRISPVFRNVKYPTLMVPYCLSPDGSTLIYSIQEDIDSEENVMMNENIFHSNFREPDDFTYTSDGKLLYTAKKDLETGVVVFDGRVVMEKNGRFSRPTVDKNGNSFAACLTYLSLIGRVNFKKYVCLNGRRFSEVYRGKNVWIDNIVFSPDGKSLAWTMQENHIVGVVHDDNTIIAERYDKAIFSNVVFCGNTIAYQVSYKNEELDRFRVYINFGSKKISDEYDDIAGPVCKNGWIYYAAYEKESKKIYILRQRPSE